MCLGHVADQVSGPTLVSGPWVSALFGLRTLGRGHACRAPPALHVHARTRIVLPFHISGGQSASCSRRTSATFSNPGKKNCGRFGRALFFWGFMFGQQQLFALRQARTLAASGVQNSRLMVSRMTNRCSQQHSNSNELSSTRQTPVPSLSSATTCRTVRQVCNVVQHHWMTVWNSTI